LGDSENNDWKIPGVSWKPVLFTPCKGQKWVESVYPEDEKQEINENGICFNDETPIPISGGENWKKSVKLMIHLFPCQANEHKTCLPSIFFG
jgi:hypothetical protein